MCTIDLFSKYAWVVPIKDKKGSSIVNEFKKILIDSTELHSNGKPNKIWVNQDKILVNQGSEFYNNTSKDFLKTNNIEIYST